MLARKAIMTKWVGVDFPSVFGVLVGEPTSLYQSGRELWISWCADLLSADWHEAKWLNGLRDCFVHVQRHDNCVSMCLKLNAVCGILGLLCKCSVHHTELYNNNKKKKLCSQSDINMTINIKLNLSLTLANVFALHIFKCRCPSSCNQDRIPFPALVFLLAGLAPHHTEVTHSILTAARTSTCCSTWWPRSQLRVSSLSCCTKNKHIEMSIFWDKSKKQPADVTVTPSRYIILALHTSMIVCTCMKTLVLLLPCKNFKWNLKAM